MKRTTIFFTTFIMYASTYAQVATMEMKEPIKGLCHNTVYVMMEMFGGQKEAVCPVSNEDIVARLTKEVTFLKDSTAYNDKGMVSIVINCNGEVVQCEMDNKTKSPLLDEQIVAVFNSLGTWKPGLLKKKPVDTVRLWSIVITNGIITVD